MTDVRNSDNVPDHYKGNVRKEAWFKRAFLDGMNSQRSNTSTRIRRGAADSIYDCRAADTRTLSDRRKFREEIGWYKYEDREGGEYAPLDVPILHEDGGREYNIHTCFLNPVLLRLTSLKAVCRDDNMGRIHGINHTEPGAIVGTCVLANWGKSPDVRLHPRGDDTNIDYERRFEEYLEILTTGLRKKGPRSVSRC
ncbi:hypothetical protein B0H11DRAFT_2248233 [Mycena galericulata]|nr:hypothetical protein B0H11DRAFT_2248233 [Mycena galericulata]